MVKSKPEPRRRTQAAGPEQQPPNPAQGRTAPPPRGAAAIQLVQLDQDPEARQIPRAAFKRQAYEILKEFKVIYTDGGYRYHSKAIDVLQEAAEAYLTLLFQDAQLCAKHACRKTIMVKDLKLAERLATIGVIKLEAVASSE